MWMAELAEGQYLQLHYHAGYKVLVGWKVLKTYILLPGQIDFTLNLISLSWLFVEWFPILSHSLRIICQEDQKSISLCGIFQRQQNMKHNFTVTNTLTLFSWHVILCSWGKVSQLHTNSQWQIDPNLITRCVLDKDNEHRVEKKGIKK